MATNKYSDIDELQREFYSVGDDFGKLMMLIGKFGINCGHDTPNSASTAKQLISNHIASELRSTEDKLRTLDLRCKSLREKLKEGRVHQDTCASFFDRATLELPNLSIFMTCQLYRICQNYNEQLRARSQKLKAGRLQILVTGEVCAGKSSVLSLLMGGPYLPVDHGQCTKIPCEVVHSEERKAYLHFKNEYGIDPTEVKLHYDENHASWKRIKDCIVLGKDSGSNKILEKVVLHWPLVILASQEAAMLYKPTDTNETGPHTDHPLTDPEGMQPISFIDVPGIFDNEQSFLTLYPYILTSDAFIIVVNNADQLGLAEDRVVRLLKIIQNFSEDYQGTFHPKFCLFVCNKWDRVPQERRDSLHIELTKGLRRVWPSVSGRQVVPCVASPEILRAVKTHSVGEECEMFFHKMCGFLETIIRSQIEVNSWWLTSFLDKSTVVIRNVNDVKQFAKQRKKDVTKQIETFKVKLQEFDEKRREVEQTVSKYTEEIKSKVKDAISTSLQNNITKLSTWDALSIPRVRPDEDWIQQHNEIITAIAERLERHIREDQTIRELQNKFDECIRKLLTDLVRSYENLEKQMPLIVEITNGMESKFEGIDTALRKPRDMFPYVAAGLAVVFFPLAPFILILWSIIDEIGSPKVLCNQSDFTTDSYRYMELQTRYYIDNVVKNKLATVTEAAVQDVPRNVNHMLAFLHNCVLKHSQSADDLLYSISSGSTQGDSSSEMENISDQMKSFVIDKVLIDDIDENSLIVDLANPLTVIGRGAYSKVHRGSLITDEANLEIAVKQIRWPRGDGDFPDNPFIIRELLTLQMLSQKPRKERRHFIEYHGFQKTVGTYDFQLLLVTDLYDYNLKSLIETERLVLPSTPGSLKAEAFPAEATPRTVSWAYVLHIARQAAKGLQFLHRYNIVHRDIKPSNYLLRFTKTDIQIYLADLGMSKQIHLIQTRGPYVGTDLYNAPEVRNSRHHSTASDVYSLCLIFYELWYGKTVYAELSDAQLRNQRRDPPRLTKVVPPDPFLEHIRRGWHANPSMRPNIMTIVTGLEQLCSKYPWLNGDDHGLLLYNRTSV